MPRQGRNQLYTARIILLSLTVTLLIACDNSSVTQKKAVSLWSETSVRKILHTFAYGGQATDEQIKAWAGMEPRAAIQQILTFDEVNPRLSPPEDATARMGGTLKGLQSFWGSSDQDNPVREDHRTYYDTFYTYPDGSPNAGLVVVNGTNMQRSWVSSINKRGLNPFRQKVGLFLTNYHMAVSTHKVRPALIRSMYDDIMTDLAQGKPFEQVLARGASSAAVAMQYGHQYNRFNNTSSVFRGNDDFAREFHQLFFRILGEDYTADYHENTTIEHTAWTLTGMGIDRSPTAWGVMANLSTNDYWTDIIDSSDHIDADGRTLSNMTNHHADGLEILGKTIYGTTPREKIYALSEVAINERESLDSMPVFLVNFFADDNLNDEKISEIGRLWRSIEPRNLLSFLQEYAISSTFLRSDTYKYRTAFSRNLALFNLNTVDNDEAYHNSWSPIWMINTQGALPFAPAHDVFGGQTSINAANNPDIFKSAYNSAVDGHWFVVKHSENYVENSVTKTWEKDWAKVIPKNVSGVYRVGEIAEWLWQRFIADGLKNYGPLERAYITAFLATGNDFGMTVDEFNPDVTFTAKQLESEPYKSYIAANEAVIMKLDSTDQNTRRTANYRIGWAINFISMTPYMFAMEGQ